VSRRSYKLSFVSINSILFTLVLNFWRFGRNAPSWKFLKILIIMNYLTIVNTIPHPILNTRLYHILIKFSPFNKFFKDIVGVSPILDKGLKFAGISHVFCVCISISFENSFKSKFLFNFFNLDLTELFIFFTNILFSRKYWDIPTSDIFFF
jgi:hypothetical protein